MKNKENNNLPLRNNPVDERPLPDTFCQISDASLWAFFREGHPKAFDMIYERHFQALCWYGDKICPDKALVEDVIQDLFIALWTRRTYLGQTDSIKFYLFRCLRRKLLRSMMQESKKKDTLWATAKTAFPLTDKITDTSSIEQEREEMLTLALQKLTDRQREAIYLKFYNNLSFQQVASVMEIEIRAVYNLIGRTIDILRADMKEPGKVTAITFLSFIVSILNYFV